MTNTLQRTLKISKHHKTATCYSTTANTTSLSCDSQLPKLDLADTIR
uniref:Uncharacterized protein n=1 Tax=Arundo donax TaxID=35708 RepID=A0A0A9J4L4_ARUDO